MKRESLFPVKFMEVIKIMQHENVLRWEERIEKEVKNLGRFICCVFFLLKFEDV